MTPWRNHRKKSPTPPCEDVTNVLSKSSAVFKRPRGALHQAPSSELLSPVTATEGSSRQHDSPEPSPTAHRTVKNQKAPQNVSQTDTRVLPKSVLLFEDKPGDKVESDSSEGQQIVEDDVYEDNVPGCKDDDESIASDNSSSVSQNW